MVTREEISEPYARLAFQYEAAIAQLLDRKIIDQDFVNRHRKTGIVKRYSEESPGYIIQSWMRSRNTLEFLRQWENDMNAEFDDRACEELIHQGHTTSLTITPTLWIRRTHAVGMHVKQGKGGGVSAYPEIAADFHLWLDPKMRLAIVWPHTQFWQS